MSERAARERIEGELKGLGYQRTKLEDDELKNYADQIDAMRVALTKETDKTGEYKAKFKALHDDESRAGAKGEDGGKGGIPGVIVPGGPGHMLNQHRELERMEDIEDYEDYVQRREDKLWDKIDLLVEKM